MNRKIFPWIVEAKKIVYKNSWMTVREDSFAKKNGKKGVYGVVEISPAVGIIPVDENGNVYLLRHWRYPSRKVSIEIPLGGIEKSERPRHAAQRELIEETGLVAKKLKFLGTFESSNAMTTDSAFVFIAQVKNSFQKVSDNEEIIDIMKVSLQQAIRLIQRDKITEAISKGAILLYAFEKYADTIRKNKIR